jgi:hypothetical protein
MRIVLALVVSVTVLAACDDHGSRPDGGGGTCQFESVLSRDVPPAAAFCGSLQTTATDAQRMSARDCAAQDIMANREFVVSWDIQGIDSRVARAFYGKRTTTLELRAIFYDGDPGGGGGEARPSASTSSCASILPTSTCTSDDLKNSLCLQCTQSALVDNCSSP